MVQVNLAALASMKLACIATFGLGRRRVSGGACEALFTTPRRAPLPRRRWAMRRWTAATSCLLTMRDGGGGGVDRIVGRPSMAAWVLHQVLRDGKVSGDGARASAVDAR